MGGADEAALGKVLGQRVPKTQKGRRIMRKREPQLVEDPKTALIMRGNSSNDVMLFLRDLHTIRNPLSTLFSRKHPEHPFEDVSRLESTCSKQGHNLFVFGSSSKKRPFRIIFGRLFDSRLLDMIEYNVKDYRQLNSFHASKREAVLGSKPLVIFQGAAFETNESLKRTKSLLLDFFGAAKPDKVLLSGIDQVIVCTTFDTPPPAAGSSASEESDPPVSVRRFRVLQQKSGSRLPRVELEEIGPRFTLTLDRQKGPDKDKWKQAIKVPKAVKPTKVKNVAKDTMGKREGRVHLGRQDFDQIHTVHHGASKRKKAKEDAEAVAGKKMKKGSGGSAD
jgi:ribosome production factor 2